jgi:hypothetical protein
MRIFGPKKYEVTGGWRKMHNKELRNLQPSPSIIRTIESRSMRWAGNVAHELGREMFIGYWWKSQKERDNQDVYWWVINIEMYLVEIG